MYILLHCVIPFFLGFIITSFILSDKGQSVASWLFERAQLLIVITFLATMALLCYMMFSKNKVNMTIDEARREYRKEIIEAYHQGWVDGFDAFINRAVTTDMVQMQYEADKNKYLEKKGE